MAVRPVDAEKYMELLKEQYLHHEAMGNKQVAKAWQGAMQLLYDTPTLTPPNEPLTCEGCIHEHNEHENCNYCKRASYLGDYYYCRPPEGE